MEVPNISKMLYWSNMYASYQIYISSNFKVIKFINLHLYCVSNLLYILYIYIYILYICILYVYILYIYIYIYIYIYFSRVFLLIIINLFVR